MDVKHLPVSFLRKRCHYIYRPVFRTDTCHCNRSVRQIMQSTSEIARKEVKNEKFARHFKRQTKISSEQKVVRKKGHRFHLQFDEKQSCCLQKKDFSFGSLK